MRPSFSLLLLLLLLLRRLIVEEEGGTCKQQIRMDGRMVGCNTNNSEGIRTERAFPSAAAHMMMTLL